MTRRALTPEITMKIDSQTITTLRFDSPMGGMRLAATTHGLAGAWFEGQRHWPATDSWRETQDDAVLQTARAQLLAYLAGERGDFDLPLDLSHGTAFQQAVWQALLAIPRGETHSYGQLSHSIDRPQAVRAVGAAVGRNPLSVVVPCHRVVGSDGSLTGYAGGLPRKQALLALEGVR